MVSRKTQMAWMAAGGVLCLFTVVISCKVREGNRCAAEIDKPPIAVVPVTPYANPTELKPLAPESGTPLPPITSQPNPVVMPPTIEPMTSDIRPISIMIPAVQPAPPSTAPASTSLVPPIYSPGIQPINPTDVPTIKRTMPTVTPTAYSSDQPAPPPPSVPSVVAGPPTVQLQPPPVPADPVVIPPPLTATREPGEPPLAPQPGPVVQYHVRQGGEYLKEIARKTLGNSERWVEVGRLNPNLSAEARLSTGTLVRLPADACIPAEELGSVQPLPALKPFKPEPGKPKVVLPLTGTFPCNLDDQRTLLLPKSIRDQFGSIDTVMISPGADQCLWVTSQAQLERLAQRLDQSPAKEVDVRTFKRLYFAQTEKASMTAEGRVAISERLAQFAGLHQEVVLVGIDDHFELWDVARWKDFTQKKSAAARAHIVAEQE